MAENAEHAAAHNLQERINTIERKMGEVKREQDQVKLALSGGDMYLGMTRESHGQDLLVALRQLREEAHQLGTEKIIILEAQKKLGEDKPSFLWMLASGQGGGASAPPSATRTAPSPPGPPPQARASTVKVGSSYGEEKIDVKSELKSSMELDVARGMPSAVAGVAAASTAPAQAPPFRSQAPASIACSGPADGMKIEVISVDDEPQEVISLDDDESQDTSSQGGDCCASEGASSAGPNPPVTAAATDYFPEGGSQDEERERLSDPEPSETPSDIFVPVYDGASIDQAVDEGDISTLQAAFDEDHTWVARRGRRVAQRAAESGNFEVLKWAVAQGCKLSDRVSIAAAANGGDIEMLLFLIHAKCPFPKKISAPCEEAASEGNLEVLGLLRQMDCQWGEGTSTAAARNGHLHVLQWTRSQDPPCPWNEQTCAMAALSGHLQLIQWARSNGCPWDEATTLNAAHKGHLTVFQWAVENGCRVDMATCNKWGSKDVLKWINESMATQTNTARSPPRTRRRMY